MTTVMNNCKCSALDISNYRMLRIHFNSTVKSFKVLFCYTSILPRKRYHHFISIHFHVFFLYFKVEIFLPIKMCIAWIMHCICNFGSCSIFLQWILIKYIIEYNILVQLDALILRYRCWSDWNTIIIVFLYNLQPTSLPIETLMSSHNSNLPISENTENDTQLTQLDHPDSIDGKFSIFYFHFSYS